MPEIKVGDQVVIKDLNTFADECFRLASGPGDVNAALSVELYDLAQHGRRIEFTVYSVTPQPSPYPPYLTIAHPSVAGGDDFGVNANEVDLVDQPVAAVSDDQLTLTAETRP